MTTANLQLAMDVDALRRIVESGEGQCTKKGSLCTCALCQHLLRWAMALEDCIIFSAFSSFKLTPCGPSVMDMCQGIMTTLRLRHG